MLRFARGVALCAAALLVVTGEPAVATPEWSVVTRLPAGSSAYAVVGAEDVWAVGDAVHHWDGRRWARVRLPGREGMDGYSQVIAGSRTDVWVLTRADSTTRSRFAHWNGKRWRWEKRLESLTPFKAPVTLIGGDLWFASSFGPWNATEMVRLRGGKRKRTAAPGVSVKSVAASAPGDLWAVGQKWKGGGSATAHWDGKKWRSVAVPRLGYGELAKVRAVSRKEAWAVGTHWTWSDAESDLVHHPVALRWNGRSWKELTTKGIGDAGYLDELAPDGRGGVWTALDGRLAHYSGGRWSTSPFPLEAAGVSLSFVAGTLWGVLETPTGAVLARRSR